MKSMPLSKYYEIRKPKYITVQLIPTKSNRNNSTQNIASLINKIYKSTNKLIYIENKKLVIESQLKASYYIHISKKKVSFFFVIPKIHYLKFKSKFSETWKNIEIKEVDCIPINPDDCTKYQLKYKLNDALSLNVDLRNNDLLNSNMSVLEILEANESVGIFYNFIPTSEKESNYQKITYKEAIERYKQGENLKKSKNLIDLGVISLKFLISFFNDLIESILNVPEKNSCMFNQIQKINFS